MFLANYGDTLTDAPLDHAHRGLPRGRCGGGVPLRPADELPVSRRATREDDRVAALLRPDDADLWINGGYFILRSEIFDTWRRATSSSRHPSPAPDRGRRPAGDSLRGLLGTVDTLRDVEPLEALVAGGRAPWTVWPTGSTDAGPGRGRLSRQGGRGVSCSDGAARAAGGSRPRVLVVSAHPDDAEIGAGGTDRPPRRRTPRR